MIASWRISQFKSVTDEISLRLAPLTIFSGANSAGKSTIIQSMLLTTQSIQSPLTGKAVVLNGHMARLGTYSDLVSFSEKTKRISIGFSLNLDDDMQFPHSRMRRLPQRSFHVFHNSDLNQIDVDYSFSSLPGPDESLTSDLLNLQPVLESSKLSVKYTNQDGHEIEDKVEVTRSTKSLAQKLQDLKIELSSSSQDLSDTLKFDVKKPQNFMATGNQTTDVQTTPVGAIMHHFVPRATTVRYDEIEAQVATQIDSLTKSTYYNHPRRENRAKSPMPIEAIDFISSSLEPLLANTPEFEPLTPYGQKQLREAISELKKTKSAPIFQQYHRKMQSRDSAQVLNVLERNRAEIKKQLRAGRHAKYTVELSMLGDNLSAGAEYVHSFFTNNVKYLGPLRDEPRALYPLATSSDPSDVGFRGEYTAAVLHAYKGAMIEYIPSKSLAEDNVNAKIEEITFSSAIEDWLEYMGVGKSFSTIDSGKLGHELKITTNTSNLQHDLTQVGVGVSQVLPILVLALLAERGSTLIFEQPELHLHPRVQSKLADFFVSMNMLGKQCIVETHSEYLINRIRIRAASADTSEVADSVIIYFVEKPGERSNYRQVRVDELGQLDNWPDGFFDEGEKSTALLLRKGIEKRRKRGTKDGTDIH